MNKPVPWRDELQKALSEVRTNAHSHFNKGACRRAIERVIRGVRFLKRNGYQFVGLTRKSNFSMLDSRHDVLAKAGPHNGAAVRCALSGRQRGDYGFDPSVQLFHDEWNNLYTGLWRAAGQFFARNPHFDVK